MKYLYISMHVFVAILFGSMFIDGLLSHSITYTRKGAGTYTIYLSSEPAYFFFSMIFCVLTTIFSLYRCYKIYKSDIGTDIPGISNFLSKPKISSLTKRQVLNILLYFAIMLPAYFIIMMIVVS